MWLSSYPLKCKLSKSFHNLALKITCVLPIGILCLEGPHRGSQDMATISLSVLLVACSPTGREVKLCACTLSTKSSLTALDFQLS